MAEKVRTMIKVRDSRVTIDSSMLKLAVALHLSQVTASFLGEHENIGSSEIKVEIDGEEATFIVVAVMTNEQVLSGVLLRNMDLVDIDGEEDAWESYVYVLLDDTEFTFVPVQRHFQAPQNYYDMCLELNIMVEIEAILS